MRTHADDALNGVCGCGVDYLTLPLDGLHVCPKPVPGSAKRVRALKRRYGTAY